MRLLQHGEGDTFSFTKDFLEDDEIPPYAILSHTWGEEEVSFTNINDGSSKSKKGYEKIQFCGEQAQHDGLQYFWVDTCCINKPDTVELQDAINSMFRWYQNAAKCYVYLTDVVALSDEENTDDELLAPEKVEFFSIGKTLLGDKKGLATKISAITGIPTRALQENCLNDFTTDQRFSWVKNRKTTRKEDKAYSLLGIFGIFMQLNYGEGEENAFKRLRRKIEKSQRKVLTEWSKDQQEIIRKLRVTDPRHDKKRIEETKGGLLADSYLWVLSNPVFKKWHTGDEDRILWIKGDPGKGKTMLLCGIIDEVEKSSKDGILLSYFFCQNTDSRINNATAVLQGLLYMMISKKPALISHIQSVVSDSAGSAFEDVNAWVTLSETLMNMLLDPALEGAIIVIDALDECTTDLAKLLNLIVTISAGPYPVKLVVSSRNIPEIENQLVSAENKETLSLEMNAKVISEAVGLYIQHKVTQLAKRRKYDQKTLNAVLEHCTTNAQDTFLWVALTCQSLENISRWNVMKKLATFPSGLGALYTRMVEQINSSEDAVLMKNILACATTTYRPIKLVELTVLAQELEDFANDYESLREIIHSCGSFLTLRDDTIYFVHQSAKDFLSAEGMPEIMPHGKHVQHRALLSSNLCALSSDALHRDMYGLHNFGHLIEEVIRPTPDPLASLAYSCVYWIDHLCESNLETTTDTQEILRDIFKFLSTKYLYWLEALSLLRSIPDGVLATSKLASFFQSRRDDPTLSKFTYDAHRFIMYNAVPITRFPLQTYASPLLFSPVKGTIHQFFQNEWPAWVNLKPETPGEWGPLLRTLEDNSHPIHCIAFSQNSELLASASDFQIKIWNMLSGQCLRDCPLSDLYPMDSHSFVESLRFSHDSQQIAIIDRRARVKICNVRDMKLTKTLEPQPLPDFLIDDESGWGCSIWYFRTHSTFVFTYRWQTFIWNLRNGTYTQLLESSAFVLSLYLSNDTKFLTVILENGLIQMWNIETGECLRNVDLGRHLREAFFTKDTSRLVASTLEDILIWDVQSGQILHIFQLDKRFASFAVSEDLSQIAIDLHDGGLMLQDGRSNGKMLTLDHPHQGSLYPTISCGGKYLAAVYLESMIKIWDLDQCKELQNRDETEKQTVHGLSVFDRSLKVAMRGDTLKVWDVQGGKYLPTIEYETGLPNAFEISQGSTEIAAVGRTEISIWNVLTGKLLLSLRGHHQEVISCAFSTDTRRLVSTSRSSSTENEFEKEFKIWDLPTGQCLSTFKKDACVGAVYKNSEHIPMTFSHDSELLALPSYWTVDIHDTKTGDTLLSFNATHTYDIKKIAFSADSTRLAVLHERGAIDIWDTNMGVSRRPLHFDSIEFSSGVNRIAYGATTTILYTNIGKLDLEATAAQKEIFQHSCFEGLACARDSVTCDCKFLLWIPPDYRYFNSQVEVLENTIIIVDSKKRAWVYEFDFDKLAEADSRFQPR